MPSSKTPRTTFLSKDLAEVIVGGCTMAFPTATTAEVWDLGKELGTGRVLLFAVASVLCLALTVRLLHHDASVPLAKGAFFKRLIATYGVTLIIAALLLWGLARFDLLGEPWVSLKRAILVAFPASFAATVVDSFGD